MTTTKLRNVPNNTWVTFYTTELLFHKLEDEYGYCTDKKGNPVRLKSNTKVIVDNHKTGIINPS